MTEDKSEKENENDNNGGVAGDEIKEDNVTTVDIIATGGVDDLVKVWEYTPDGEMKLKHKLSDHSLGVVSVDLSKDVKSKLRNFGRIFREGIRNLPVRRPNCLHDLCFQGLFRAP